MLRVPPADLSATFSPLFSVHPTCPSSSSSLFPPSPPCTIHPITVSSPPVRAQATKTQPATFLQSCLGGVQWGGGTPDMGVRLGRGATQGAWKQRRRWQGCPSSLWGMGDERGECGSPPMPAQLRDDSERSTLCETVAVKPGRGLSCPRACVPGVLQELLRMKPALVSKAAASISRTEPWPRDPLRYRMLLPEAPRACSRGQATPPWGATSPHATAVPPSPPCLTPWAAWRGACSEQPWAETRRSPRAGGFGKPVAPGGRAAKRSGRRHTRQQSSHSAECHTTDGNMQRDTGSVRQTNSPT
ncbi:uncharacterized protein ACIBXB_022289 [Morphnus guianensis]